MLVVLRFCFRLFSKYAPRWSGRLAAKLFLTPSRHKVRSGKNAALRDAAERHVLLVDDQRITVYRWRNRGPRVLLVHGWSDCAANLGELIERLHGAGYDIVAPDLPAHGSSGRGRTNMREWQRVLRQLSLQAGEWQAVIGHSLGGFAAAAATQSAFERYGPAVRTQQLVLVAAPDRSVDMLRMFGAFLRIPRQVQDYAAAEISRLIHADFAAFSTAEALAGFEGDALLIHDRDDSRVPFTHFEQLRQRAPRHEVLETRGLGHRRLLGDPEVLARITSFVGQEGALPVNRQRGQGNERLRSSGTL